jgi:hypothetical protein
MIKSSKETTAESFQNIKDGQSGAYKPLKTRFKHLNDICHGGLTKQKIYSLGALSAFGKSHILRQIETDIFDEELNPGAKESVILCKVDWEMSKEEMILSKVHAKTGKPYSELMFEIPDAETEKAFNEVYSELNSDHIFETFNTYKPDDFYNDIRAFTDKHQDKKQIVLTIDNINLVDTDNSDESTAIAKLITHIIRLKREVKNLTILILCQLNRQLKERILNPKEHFPRTTDFYYSSKIEHASDVQIVIHNPFLLGLDEYGAVNTERFDYLDNYLIPKNKYSCFKTQGLVFFHYVKVRLKNGLKDFKDLYIEEIYQADDNKANVPKQISTTIPNFTTPVFEKEKPILPNFDISSAFDAPDKKDDKEPF